MTKIQQWNKYKLEQIFQSTNEQFITNLASFYPYNIVACAINPESRINIYNIQNDIDSMMEKTHIYTKSIIKSIEFTQKDILSICSNDTLISFDIEKEKNTFIHPTKNATCMTILDTICVYGNDDGNLTIIDIRSNTIIVSDTIHNGEITKVKFHPSYNYSLCSSGDDGTVLLYDLRQINTLSKEFTIDTSLQNVYPINQPIQDFQFVGPMYNTLSIISTIETLTLYDLTTCEMLIYFNTFRQDLNKLVYIYLEQNGIQDHDSWSIDTIVNCEYRDAVRYNYIYQIYISYNYILYKYTIQKIRIIVGTISGGIIIARLNNLNLEIEEIFPPHECHNSRIRDILFLQTDLVMSCEQSNTIGLWKPEVYPLKNISHTTGPYRSQSLRNIRKLPW